MRNAKAMPWVIGTILLSLVLAAAAWMLGISPMLDTASEARDQAEQEASRADQLEIQLAALKKDYENIDEFRADLAALQAQVPAEVDLEALTRYFNDLAVGSNVFVRTLNSSMALAVTGPPVIAAAVTTTDAGTTDAGATTEGTAATDTTAADGTAASGTAAATTVQGLYAVPFDITVVGGYQETVAFLKALQSDQGRLLVVNNIVANSLEEAAATNGTPATHKGDLETTVSLWALVLTDDATVTTDGTVDATGEQAELAPLPVPAAGDAPITVTN
ncbi:hypothetical protein OEB99_09710 [Actinotalea sp. M2MS4P-6]|uniref:hypothetical protein n=1 Tax=Actinotalea sp. M2MS4P-6 TaxID=2983762 RepID=UPI0021E45591|nr:hypothetical protein [Actinotalea sp. M2MS4P-6]MCV2394581.1 hypothetical protein [Actinotalea sp. M2MS4P-6]